MSQSKPASVKKTKSEIIVSFATVFAIFATVYTLGGWAIHSNLDALVLRPQVGSDVNDDIAPIAGVKNKSFEIPTPDGSTLHCCLFPVAGSSQITIVNHGNAGAIANRVYIASALVKAGSSALLYDYRGYGTSTGKATIPGINQDGLTVYDYVRDKMHYSPQKILLYGESIGTCVTCFVAAQRPCAAVILQSGIAALHPVAIKLFPLLRIYSDMVFESPDLDNIRNIAKVQAPILLLHGVKDKLVSYKNSEELFAAAHDPKKLVLLPSCGHNDMGVYDTKTFLDSIADFVRQFK